MAPPAEMAPPPVEEPAADAQQQEMAKGAESKEAMNQNDIEPKKAPNGSETSDMSDCEKTKAAAVLRAALKALEPNN